MSPLVNDETQAVPPVVLVHGFASSFDHGWQATGWADVLADEGREVLGADLPGHGAAQRPTEPAAYHGFERAALDWWPPDTATDAVGFSLGGQVLLRLAAEHPHRFRRLVVLGVGGSVLAPDRDTAGPDTPADEMIDMVFGRLIEAARNEPAALRALLASRPTLVTEDVLRRVRLPVLLVIGSADFTGSADRLAELLPDATLTVVPGADHFGLPFDYRTIEAALRFLAA
jgi:pimeloyl-ACP methyl ester carboxylesterase